MNRVDRAPGVSLVTDHPAYELPPVTEEALSIPEDFSAVTLLERDYAGLRVELNLSEAGHLSLLVREGLDDPQIVSIPPDKGLDAFNHPYCYLP